MLLYRSLGMLVNLIQVLILVRIVMSFINFSRDNPISHFVYEMTEPILAPARALIAKIGINTGMFDFSPILAMLFLKLFMDLVRSIIF